jgi:hypothetical protein
MSKFYLQLAPYIPFSPVLLAGVGAAVSYRLSRGRWIIHIFVFTALIFALPASFYLLGLADPSTIENPGYGEGFAILAYLLFAALAALGYSFFSWLIYWDDRQNRAAIEKDRL